MRSLRIALALLVMLPGVASADDAVTFYLAATDAGFVSPDASGPNPTLVAPPGAHVAIYFRNNASVNENFRLGDPFNVETPCCQRPGESATLAFDIPANSSGQIPYWSRSDPTRLHGIIQIGELPPRVRFTQPADGATVGDSVEARVAIAGTGAWELRYALDGANVSDVTTSSIFVYTNLSEGHHLLHVEVVTPNGTYVEPRVFAEVVVYRGRDLSTPTDAGATTTTTASPTPAPSARTPGLGTVATIGAAALVSFASRRRR